MMKMKYALLIAILTRIVIVANFLTKFVYKKLKIKLERQSYARL